MALIRVEGVLIQPNEVIDGGVLRGGPLNVRFDPAVIASHIQDAEDRWLREVLCDDLYNDMVAKVNPAGVSNYNSSCGPLVTKYVTGSEPHDSYEAFWLARLWRYATWAVVLEALPFITIQLGSAGAFFNNNEFGENIQISGAKWLGDTMQERVETQREQIIKYLCANADDLPLWGECHCSTCGCACDDLSDGCCGRCSEKCLDAGKDAGKHMGIITY